MNETKVKAHCCPNISLLAKLTLFMFFIIFFIGIIQFSFTKEAANQKRNAAVLSYANQLGLSKDISASYQCINNQVHYKTSIQLLGANYSLLQPIIACDSAYYQQSTRIEPSYSMLKVSGGIFILALVISLIRLKIDPDLKAYQARKVEKRSN